MQKERIKKGIVHFIFPNYSKYDVFLQEGTNLFTEIYHIIGEKPQIVHNFAL